MKRINWKRGSASVFIGLSSVFACFAIVMFLFQQYLMFSQYSAAQIVTDITIDGATSYAQDLKSVDLHNFNMMAGMLIDQNTADENTDMTVEDLLMEETEELRANYTDTYVTIQTKTKYGYGNRTIDASAKVLSLAFVPNNTDITQEEVTIIRYFLSQLPRNSVQYKAIEYVISGELMHKPYGGCGVEISMYYKTRMGPCYDCSGFVSKAYQKGAGLTYSYDSENKPDFSETTTVAYRANKKSYHEGLSDIKPGDVLCWHYPAQEEGERDAGHVGIYLGELPDELAQRLGIVPGTKLMIDSAHYNRPLLSNSPFGATSPLGTNWGVQIRAVNMSHKNLEGYCDMDVFNDEENSLAHAQEELEAAEAKETGAEE